MDIASLGPMVVVPADEELDRELEYRRLKEEKSRTGPVTVADMGDGGPGTSTDQDGGGAAARLADFLKQFQGDKSDRKSTRRSAGKIESLEAHRKRRDQVRQKAIAAYQYQLQFEEHQATRGLQLKKSVG
ncbi:MAG: hypothetical protein KDD68_20295 [Bdellovibrionales bacterium]|nr:hypothetical protein [Bdellovibrionales bacterium]